MAGWSNLTAMQRPVQWAVHAGYDVCVAGSTDLYPENTPPNYQHFQVSTPWHRDFSSIAGEEQTKRVQGQWSTLKLVDIGRLFRPDIVHAHGVTMVADWCLQARLQPLVVSAWGALNKILTGERTWEEMPEHAQRVLPAADAVIVESPALVDVCASLPHPPRRVELIPLGTDTRRFDLDSARRHAGPWRRTLGIPDDSCVLLSPRGWDETYGQHSILEAYALARPAFRRPTILAFTKMKRNSSSITGPYFERVAHRAAELEVAEYVRWIPSLRYEMMPTLYALADVIVSFPSQDAFPSTLVEAAACSRPVISASMPSYRGTFFEDCFTLAEAGNVIALAAAMVEVVNDPAGQDERVAAARRIVVEQYDESVVRAKLFALYEELAS